MFNKYFSSMCIVDNGHFHACGGFTLQSTLETVTFIEVDIMAAIKKLKPNLSSGPDKLPPLFFRKSKYSLARPLSLICKQLLSVGCVPDDWTKAIITPVHKKRYIR